MMPRNSNFDHNKSTVRNDFVNPYHKDINGQKIVFDIKRGESKKYKYFIWFNCCNVISI